MFIFIFYKKRQTNYLKNQEKKDKEIEEVEKEKKTATREFPGFRFQT